MTIEFFAAVIMSIAAGFILKSIAWGFFIFGALMLFIRIVAVALKNLKRG